MVGVVDLKGPIVMRTPANLSSVTNKIYIGSILAARSYSELSLNKAHNVLLEPSRVSQVPDMHESHFCALQNFD